MKTFGKVGAVIGVILVIVFAKGIGKMVGKSTVRNYNESKIEAAIEQTLLDTSKKINAQLPMMVDNETRLDLTICAGKHVMYKYTMVNVSENDIDKKGFVDEMKSMLVKNQCGNENMVKMLKMGVQYDYMYQDRNGILLGTISISKSDCGF